MFKLLVAVLLPVASVGAQTFEVASIKPTDPASGVQSGTASSVGRFEATGTLKTFIWMAYGFQAFQVSGGPNWLNTDRFDISAKVAQSATPDERKRMLQALLAERFQLASHRETRELPVYALQVGRNGPKLQAAIDEGMSAGRGSIKGNMQVSDLVRHLSAILGRTVTDQTGLKGIYAVKLAWAPEGLTAEAAADPAGPSIFTALQEQLGLRLEPSKDQVEIFVIDHAEKPSEN